MKISNLHKGQIFKNYKELCQTLEIEPKKSGSNPYKAQFKELERYCFYHKEGQKIIIDIVFNEVKEKVDNRANNKGGNNIKYADDMEYLMLRLLNKFNTTDDIEPLGFSKNLLYANCGLINDNYKLAKGKTLHLSQLLNMPTQTINECFDYTTNKVWNTLRTTLNSLQRRALIKWGNGYNIVYTNQLGTEVLEVADAEMLTTIMSFERRILLEMNFYNKRLVFINGRWKEFKEKVTELIREQFDCDDFKISYYYDNIVIYRNSKDIEKAYNDYCITADEGIELKKNLNKAICNSLDTTINNRHNNAKSKEPKKITSLHNYRKSDEYIEQQTKVKNLIVDRDKKELDLSIEVNGSYTKALNHSFNDKYKVTVEDEIKNNTVEAMEQLSLFTEGFTADDFVEVNDCFVDYGDLPF